MSPISAEDVARFANLFRGNTRSYGRFIPGRKAPLTEKSRISTEEFDVHLNGGPKADGVGIVPVRDDKTCYFGAIDIDAHDAAPDIDLVDLEKNIREKDLPLTVCRSKSGGAHVYLFGAEPLNAKLVRTALAKWAALLGFPGVEIFPKQHELPTDEVGRQQLGNWINLCFHDAINESPLRYGVEGGQRITYLHFLDIAENRRITSAMLVEKAETDHGGAPPCIQKIISEGVKGGERNQALYGICVYLKQAFPETWRDKAIDLNARVFEDPLVYSEAKKTINSVSRRDYRYKCGEAPCQSRCNSDVCVTRKFGITGEEKNELHFGAPPEYGKLTRYNSSPVRWDIEIDGKSMSVSTDELSSYRKFVVSALENLAKVLPEMTQSKWRIMLNTMIDTLVEIEAPEEASAAGVIFSRLVLFLGKLDLSSDGKNKKHREQLLAGQPVVQRTKNEGRCVFWRPVDFATYLKNNRSEELKGASLWTALSKKGVCHAYLRINRYHTCQVFYLPLKTNNKIHLVVPEVKSEF